MSENVTSEEVINLEEEDEEPPMKKKKVGYLVKKSISLEFSFTLYSYFLCALG